MACSELVSPCPSTAYWGWVLVRRMAPLLQRRLKKSLNRLGLVRRCLVWLLSESNYLLPAGSEHHMNVSHSVPSLCCDVHSVRCASARKHTTLVIKVSTYRTNRFVSRHAGRCGRRQLRFGRGLGLLL